MLKKKTDSWCERKKRKKTDLTLKMQMSRYNKYKKNTSSPGAKEV